MDSTLKICRKNCNFLRRPEDRHSSDRRSSADRLSKFRREQLVTMPKVAGNNDCIVTLQKIRQPLQHLFPSLDAERVSLLAAKTFIQRDRRRISLPETTLPITELALRNGIEDLSCSLLSFDTHIVSTRSTKPASRTSDGRMS